LYAKLNIKAETMKLANQKIQDRELTKTIEEFLKNQLNIEDPTRVVVLIPAIKKAIQTTGKLPETVLVSENLKKEIQKFIDTFKTTKTA
jgi:hypothetical protein